MIKFVDGDFFDYDADIRVNTVNCVGVMGAGVALLFKRKFPKMFLDYKNQCQKKEIKPGVPSIWIDNDMFSKGVTIVNFPTKDHWKNPSEYEYIELGLVWLKNYLKNKQLSTITIPALGCGHGGLDWNKVKVLIVNYLGELDHNILVFNPESSKSAGKSEANHDKFDELLRYGVNILTSNSSLYPQELRQYTEKSLYTYGEHTLHYDVTIICSSQPSDIEKSTIINLMDYCLNNSLRILLGSSSFEKKLATAYIKKDAKIGIFLPSGIFEAARKLSHNNEIDERLSLLSLGDPFITFNKKEYLPSIIGRMLLTRRTIFTTPRLSWIKKHKDLLNNIGIKSQYINYIDLDNEEKSAMLLIQSEAISLTSLVEPYFHISI